MSSQIEGTQATLTDLFDNEDGLAVTNTEDVERDKELIDNTAMPLVLKH